MFVKKHYFMELSPFREAATCVATQELPSFLRNPNVQHRVYKKPPLVSLLTETNRDHFT
jgi:hypothetical protein